MNPNPDILRPDQRLTTLARDLLCAVICPIAFYFPYACARYADDVRTLARLAIHRYRTGEDT